MNEPTPSGREPEVCHADDEPSVPSRTRDLLVSTVTLFVSLAVVVFLTRYNMQPYPVWSRSDTPLGRTWEEYLVVNVTGLLLIPMLAVLAMPSECPLAFGWARPASRSVRVALALYVGMLIVLYVAARMPDFQLYYPIQPQAAQMWTYLLYFELTYGMYMLTWEFFFRGFMTFGLARGFGPYAAVLLQAAAFGIMHVGKPVPEIAGSFVAGIALGALALHGRSFLHCFALHWACAVTFDLLVIRAAPGGLF